jgi:cation diffusion facilitator family transporter
VHQHDLSAWTHRHRFESGFEEKAERRTRLVTGLTIVTMLVEIVAGFLSNSMALLADGFHMATHAGALGIASFAYAYARKHAEDSRFTFGTGKVGELAAFASTIILGLVCLLMVYESAIRLFHVQAIAFDEALLVAGLGLLVNLASAFILGGHGHTHHHDHDHDHDHDHGPQHDNNLKAAYVHVLADAFTSILAIGALVCGKFLGWWWLDPAMGLVGAAVIGKWAWGLFRASSSALLDMESDSGLKEEVRQAIETGCDDRLADLHLWKVGPNHWAAILSIVSDCPMEPDHYKRKLADVHELGHISVEVQRCGCSDKG